VQFFPEGTYVPPVSRRRVFTGLAVVLAAVIGLSALVGCVATDDGFDWGLASVFGTALGTTLLALATFWLGFNTDQDVRASQQLARISVQQLEETRKANRLVEIEQRVRQQPTVIASHAGGGTSGGSNNTLNAELINVGAGPAVRVEVTARYQDAARPFRDDPAVPSIGHATLSYLAPGEREIVSMNFNVQDGASIDFNRFQIKGHYLDRLGLAAGDIFDWKHEEPEVDEDTQNDVE
jgi:hypothetical protein